MKLVNLKKKRAAVGRGTKTSLILGHQPNSFLTQATFKVAQFSTAALATLVHKYMHKHISACVMDIIMYHIYQRYVYVHVHVALTSSWQLLSVFLCCILEDMWLAKHKGVTPLANWHWNAFILTRNSTHCRANSRLVTCTIMQGGLTGGLGFVVCLVFGGIYILKEELFAKFERKIIYKPLFIVSSVHFFILFILFLKV